MTPPGRGHALLREAALSPVVGGEFTRGLINPRQSGAIVFPASALQTSAQCEWCAGPPGQDPAERPARHGSCAGTGRPRPTLLLAPGHAGAEAWCAGRRWLVLDAVATVRLGLAAPGAGYLVRPDGHVAWRWQDFDAAAPAGLMRH
ncbi:hypothetical protein GCM10011504_16720 [Siccirubricoccus deserti]|uniref:aromatic-ring hydroxylase C-terminal domain-containing protein n=1 Tax=Siccirubricoccus deserti TaxID=2013562 RepID=UPI0019B622DE|nr:hypothetical protein [Siccirubricoccus deserti]GGC38924.1 hypothetical protein GCM10011504_16720 [Siccirubricoccus deserti]